MDVVDDIFNQMEMSLNGVESANGRPRLCYAVSALLCGLRVYKEKLMQLF